MNAEKKQGLVAALPERLLPWYREHARALPWRRDQAPYHVWLSEIMLQQTRVEAVLGYYSRFLETCPDIPALAACPPEVLNRLWQGLGYYTRVRNLQKAAQCICRDYGGEFPRDIAAIRALPGIGPYTAGAIASICFEQPEPAVDGNVLRVMTRFLADATPLERPALRREITQALAAVYPAGQCGAFTQSLMELGALVCLPNGAPLCGQCPLQALCRASAAGNPCAYPVRAPKAARRIEERTVFVFSCDGRQALEKRPPEGLLAGLWQYPNVLGKLSVAQAIAQAEQWGVRPRQLEKCVERQHIFTHITWRMTAYYFQCGAAPAAFIWAAPSEIAQRFALPTAFHMFFEEMK